MFDLGSKIGFSNVSKPDPVAVYGWHMVDSLGTASRAAARSQTHLQAICAVYLGF